MSKAWPGPLAESPHVRLTIERLVNVAGPLLLVGVFGGYCSVLVHDACFHPPPPVLLPEPGTPRGRYCSAVIPEKPWILMLIAPCAIVLLTGLVVSKRRVAFVVALVLCVVLVANAIVANALTAAQSI
jgi:hypothetical protein